MDTKSDYESQIKKLQDGYRKALENIGSSHQKELGDINAAHDKNLRDMDDKMNGKEKEYLAQMEEIQNDHANIIADKVN